MLASRVFRVRTARWEAKLKRSPALRRGWFGVRRRVVHDSLLPGQFLPVARALTDGQSAVGIVTGVASDYAQAGEGLPCLLDDLHAAYRALGLAGPGAAIVRSASEAWAESFMILFGRVSCEDPLTGLATANHLRLRLAELCRSSSSAGSPWSSGDAYLLLEVLLSCSSLGRYSPRLERAFRPELQLAVVGHAIRTVFPRTDTIASVGRHTVLAIAHESDCVDSSVQDLTRRAMDHLASGYSATVRVKPLPRSLGDVQRLIDQPNRHRKQADGVSPRPIRSSPPGAVRPMPNRCEDRKRG